MAELPKCKKLPKIVIFLIIAKNRGAIFRMDRCEWLKGLYRFILESASRMPHVQSANAHIEEQG